MQTNYFEITQEAKVGQFFSEFSEKNNSNYIILDSTPKSYVDIRNLALRAHSHDEKLKNLKQILPQAKTKEESLKALLNSGAKVVECEDCNYYDIFNGLQDILEENPDFLGFNLKSSTRGEIFALNKEDSIAHARNIFLKKRINLLPIIEGLKVVGEVRPFDLLLSSLHGAKQDKADYFKESYTKDLEQLPISNISNQKPLTLTTSNTYKEAISLMVEKKLSSIIVLYNEELYSIVSYKDIFKLYSKEEEKAAYSIHYSKASELFEDEFDLVQDYIEKSMKKISHMSSYDTLNVVFKSFGNIEGSHLRRYGIKLNLQSGQHTLHIEKEMQDGKWNIGTLVIDALQALEKKVKEEKRR